MSLEVFIDYFTQYGAIAIFVVVFLEYLNLPGFPAGVIMPLAGIWAAHGKISFLGTMALTVAAGVCGSWLLYFLGYKGGSFLLEKYLKKFPSQREGIEKNFEILKRRGCIGVVFGKLIPVMRTLISIPAGVMKMNFWKYTFSSMLGVAVWNLFFVGAGYVLGDAVFGYLG